MKKLNDNNVDLCVQTFVRCDSVPRCTHSRWLQLILFNKVIIIELHSLSNT